MKSFFVPILAAIQTTPDPPLRSDGTGAMIRDWIVWFSIVVVLMTVTLVFLRRARNLAVPTDTPDSGSLFDLDKLRNLRDSGEITIQEYEALRKRAMEVLKHPAEETPSKEPRKP